MACDSSEAKTTLAAEVDGIVSVHLVCSAVFIDANVNPLNVMLSLAVRNAAANGSGLAQRLLEEIEDSPDEDEDYWVFDECEPE